MCNAILILFYTKTLWHKKENYNANVILNFLHSLLLCDTWRHFVSEKYYFCKCKSMLFNAETCINMTDKIWIEIFNTIGRCQYNVLCLKAFDRVDQMWRLHRWVIHVEPDSNNYKNIWVVLTKGGINLYLSQLKLTMFI